MKEPRVWIASKGTEKSLRLSEADGWEVHEVAKAPAHRPNSPEDIRQSMDLLQQIHRESLPSNLVSRLRAAPPFEPKNRCPGDSIYQMCAAAADEIERLTNIVKALSAGAKPMGYECPDCHQQIAFGDSICRETLRQHAAPAVETSAPHPDTVRLDWLQSQPDRFANIDRITSVNRKFNGYATLREAIDNADTLRTAENGNEGNKSE